MQQRNVWTVLSVVVMAAAAACGGGDEGGSDAPAATAAPAAPAFDAASAGNLSGMVMLDGELPAAEELRMNSDPVCAMSATDTMSSTYIGSNGHLGNVFVYVKEGLEGQRLPGRHRHGGAQSGGLPLHPTCHGHPRGPDLRDRQQRTRRSTTSMRAPR